MCHDSLTTTSNKKTFASEMLESPDELFLRYYIHKNLTGSYSQTHNSVLPVSIWFKIFPTYLLPFVLMLLQFESSHDIHLLTHRVK